MQKVFSNPSLKLISAMNLISNDKLLLFAVLHVAFTSLLTTFKIKEPNVPDGITLVRPVLLL